MASKMYEIIYKGFIKLYRLNFNFFQTLGTEFANLKVLRQELNI